MRKYPSKDLLPSQRYFSVLSPPPLSLFVSFPPLTPFSFPVVLLLSSIFFRSRSFLLIYFPNYFNLEAGGGGEYWGGGGREGMERENAAYVHKWWNVAKMGGEHVRGDGWRVRLVART